MIPRLQEIASNPDTDDEEAIAQADERAVDRATTRPLALLGEAIEIIGGIEKAAGICKMERADLHRAINRPPSAAAQPRYVRVESAIARRVARRNPSLAVKIGSAMVEAFGLEVFPRTTLTADERAERLTAYLRRMPLGDQHVEEALRGGKP